jgi:anti-sigma factor RsiW
MSCDLVEERLVAYADGELSPEEAALYEAHFRDCPECAKLLLSLRATSKSLASFPEIEPPAALKERLYAIPARKKFRINLDFLLRPALQPVFAAATALLLLFSLYMMNPEKKQIQEAVSRQIHRGYGQFEKLSAKAGSVTDSLGSYADGVFAALKRLNPLGKSDE